MNMKMNALSDRKLKILSALAAVAIGCLCWNGGTLVHAQAPATQSPQIQEIVKLTQAKMSDDVILQYIKNSGASYSLSADDILYLNSQGVSQPIISALLAAKPSGAPAPAVAPPPAPAPAPAPLAAPASPAPQVSPYPGAPVAPAPVVESVPPPGSEVSLSYFQSQLAPYGSWVDIAGYGPCWVPSVQSQVPDWRPYFNGGHWMYTDDGWAWQSDYPWGEYVFHYGRWMRDARFGWAWVPGYHWGPAWVSWRNADADGYVGWAPLPPGAHYDPAVGITWDGRVAVDADFGLAPDAYVFIPFGHFWEHDYIGWRAPGWRVPGLFHASIVFNHYGFVGGRFFFGGIGRDRMVVLTHHDIRVEAFRFHDSHIAHEHDFFHGHDYHDAHGFDHHDDHGFGHDHDRFH